MVQAKVSNVDTVISHEVARLVSCHLDELAQRLPVYFFRGGGSAQPHKSFWL
jgi:hypothetical protein